MDKLVGFARKKRLGDLLVDAGVISQDQLVKALQVQKTEKQGERLGVVLIDLGFTDEKQIVEALKAQLKIQSVDLSTLRIPEEIIRLLDEAVLRKYNLIPFKFNEKNPNLLCVAMSDPLDIRAMDDVSIITGCQVERFAATPSDIAAAIDRYYGNAEALRVAEQYTREKQEQAKARAALDPGSGNDENNVQQAPIVKLLGQIIEQAVHRRASDIHIEPMENQVRIRFRVDGVLHEAMRHDISLHAALIARIKIVSGLDISEKRRPQDGRATSIVDRQEYDIRVSVLPTVYGEKVVMRLAQKKALTLDKRDLGFPEDELKKFDHILSHPNGLILVTGPTGSGKSTTLYTALNELNVEGVNIITVEDPVEANLNGVNQVQVNEKAGLTFSSALRSILRQDPDIIMIGEIRDQETAEIAVKASITGHLVVSTLHTNSSANTITRLADMGVENYLIADSVVGVIAQRLVRRVCPACGIVREATPFKIDETLKIASTHGQWYQLDMEDPEVTVWYCLSDNENGDPCAWAGTASNGDGTGATYGASPNDAANNYYIYSKGNVFYSGVGHSTVDGDMEAKLFINTMIAAYRTTYEPPMVEILNEEAELLKEESGNGSDPNLVYKMNWMKEYGNNLDGTKEKIRFSPVELNTVRTKLTCSIQYKDGTYVDKIYKKDGTLIEGKATKENPKKYVFENLKNMGEYYFIYDTTGENKKKEGDIVFEIYNNKSKNPDGTPRVGKTTVKMESQNLFLLD